jgi:hypothetical protein
MAGAFYALRAHDMLWSRLVQRYLIGEKLRATDLDAWLSDPTRMPARMHSEYLRWLFLENRFAQGNLDIEGGGVSLKDIRIPVFAVGAERDHIAPWRSVHKLALFTAADTTFVLSGGGHNTAIVSPARRGGGGVWRGAWYVCVWIALPSHLAPSTLIKRKARLGESVKNNTKREEDKPMARSDSAVDQLGEEAFSFASQMFKTWSNADGGWMSEVAEAWSQETRRQIEDMSAHNVRAMQQLTDCKTPLDVVRVEQEWVAERSKAMFEAGVRMATLFGQVVAKLPTAASKTE